jgi:hypothetical protein
VLLLLLLAVVLSSGSCAVTAVSAAGSSTDSLASVSRNSGGLTARGDDGGDCSNCCALPACLLQCRVTCRLCDELLVGACVAYGSRLAMAVLYIHQSDVSGSVCTYTQV